MDEQKTFLGNSITDVNSKLSKWLSNYDIVNQILFRAFILPRRLVWAYPPADSAIWHNYRRVDTRVRQ